MNLLYRYKSAVCKAQGWGIFCDNYLSVQYLEAHWDLGLSKKGFEDLDIKWQDRAISLDLQHW